MEVLVSTSLSEESNTSISIWDPSSGTKLLALKGPPASPNSLVLLRDEGLLIAEEGRGKPFIHFWQVGSPLQSSRRIICPLGGSGGQKIGPITATPDGNFLVVAIGEKINVWQPATGKVVAIISSAHYRPITTLKFTDDGSLLISGGMDGIVSVWSFLQVVSSTTESKASSLHTWANHTLPVSAIHVGLSGVGRKATVFTCSEDRFLKIYSLLSGSLLLSVAFPQPLTALSVDGMERRAFLGGTDGGIYVLDLTSAGAGNSNRGREQHVMEGGGGNAVVMKKHVNRITALAISSDSLTLASGDSSGLLLIWDVISKQSLRSVITPSPGGGVVKGGISNLSFWLNDPALLKGGKGKKPLINFPEVPKLLEPQQVSGEENALTTVWNRFDADDDEEMETETFSSNSGIAEVNELRSQLRESKEINRKLQLFCAQNILGASASSSNVAVSVTEPEANCNRKRKEK